MFIKINLSINDWDESGAKGEWIYAWIYDLRLRWIKLDFGSQLLCVWELIKGFEHSGRARMREDDSDSCVINNSKRLSAPNCRDNEHFYSGSSLPFA